MIDETIGVIELLNHINECIEALSNKGVKAMVILGETKADSLMMDAIKELVMQWGLTHKSISMIEATNGTQD